MKLEIESSLEFEHTPNRLVASKGANLQLECRVDCNSSLARPRIRIEKLGSVSTTTNQLSIAGNNGTHSKLVLENIDQQRDGGRYVCFSEIVHDTETPFMYFDLVIESKSGNTSGIYVIYA